MRTFLPLRLLVLCVACCLSDNCSVDIAPEDRRDCYPWPDSNEEKCTDRGCVWCPTEVPDTPWCFANDAICPSDIDEQDRVDCYPDENATKEKCLARGCIWCDPHKPGIPACFNDSKASMGGEFCPANIPENERVDCWPEGDASKDKCLQRNCYWCSSNTPDVPWCFVPPVHGYEMVGEPVATPKGYRQQVKRRRSNTWFGKDVPTLTVDVEFQENERLRVKIYDSTEKRFEVPLDIASPEDRASDPIYDVQFSDEPSFNFKVLRKSTGKIIFDTSMGGFVFSDQFIQFTSYLPSDYVYGFGETEHHTFRHDMKYRSWAMYARDQPIVQANLYSVHPFYMALELDDQSRHSHGVLILNANAQEVRMLPTPGFIYRTTGGIVDLYFFMGPTPENVVQQYTQAIGRPVMPPYWALGFHLSRYGYNNLDRLKDTVERMRHYDIPHDGQHGDIDYFDRLLDFTFDPHEFAGLPDYVRQLRQEGTRFVTILDPCISTGEPADEYPTFSRGEEADVWVKEADGVTNVRGKVWPEHDVHFPDFSKESCQQWWIKESTIFHDQIEFEGLWLDMNEPASFVTGSVDGCDYNNVNNPLFKPPSMWGEVLADKTICPDFQQQFGRHYDVHSLYGWSQAKPTLDAVRAANSGRRSLAISRSTFPGAGKYVTHWLGDNHASWQNMHYSIIGMMEFNLFGIPFVGADICGYMGDTNRDLCARWHQLGAFYTFARNHNAIDAIDQDPGAFDDDFAADVRRVLHIRYLLLPYLYTLFHRVHVDGGTVVRPMYHEFYTDDNTYDIDTQFMWGPALMISPVLEPDVSTIRVYFPDAKWYNWYDGSLEPFRLSSGTVDADDIPLHIRGGHILPTQQPSNSTVFSRSLPMGLIVALDDDNEARGSLFWDEGDTVDTAENGEYFEAEYTAAKDNDKRKLTCAVITTGYDGVNDLILDDITVYGEGTAITSVFVSGQEWHDYYYNSTVQVLSIHSLQLPVNSEFEVTWS